MTPDKEYDEPPPTGNLEYRVTKLEQYRGFMAAQTSENEERINALEEWANEKGFEK